jgi:hypothetical protein
MKNLQNRCTVMVFSLILALGSVMCCCAAQVAGIISEAERHECCPKQSNEADASSSTESDCLCHVSVVTRPVFENRSLLPVMNRTMIAIRLFGPLQGPAMRYSRIVRPDREVDHLPLYILHSVYRL